MDRVESKKFKLIKESVKKRDGYICGVCGKYRRKGAVHHIRKWAGNPRLRYEEYNLIWVDHYCHNKKLKGNEDAYITILSEKVRKKYE